MKIKGFVEKNFFIIYFVVVVVVFFVQMLSCGTESFEQCILGKSDDNKYEILDNHKIETVFRVGKEAPEGFIIYNYQKNNIDFTDEKVIISVLDENTGKLIQKTEINLATEIGNLYIFFEEKISAGTNVRLIIESEGLEEEGPTISFSDEGNYGSVLWKDGELQNEYLCGALCYKTISYDYLKIILYFAAEMIIGLVLYGARKKMLLPLWNGIKLSESSKKAVNWKKLLLGSGFILIVLYIFMDYIYAYSIETYVAERDYDIVCQGEQQWIEMDEGDEISQIFNTDKENFSGVGIRIAKREDVSGILKLKLYNFVTGELLLEKEYRVSALTELSDNIPDRLLKREDKEVIESYVFLDLQTVLRNSEGQYYKIVLESRELQDGKLGIAAGEGENFALRKNGQDAVGNLCMVTLHSNNLFLKNMFGWMVAIIGVFCILMWTCFSLYNRIPTAKTYAISALVLGLIFCFLIPPHCVPDEWIHFDSAYRISNEMLGIGDIPGPDRIYKRNCDIGDKIGSTIDTTVDEYQYIYDGIWEKPENEELSVAYAGNAAGNVTLLNYLPVAAGFTVARMFHVGYVGMLFWGRLCNLLVNIMLMYIAIKKIPFGKTVIAVIGLLPITLQQMASCSYDGMIIGMANIFVAYCFSIIFNGNISIVDIMITTFAGAMMAVCKGGVYIPVLGLLLLVPFAGKKVDKKCLIGVLGMLFSMGMLFVAQFSEKLISLFAKSQGTSFRTGGVELYTISYFLEYPKKLIRIYQNTLIERGDSHIQGLIGGQLGKLNIVLPWFLLIAFITLIYICTLKRTHEKMPLSKGWRFYVVVLCIGSVILTLLSMLLAWTKVGTSFIDGVQGRYYLPVFGLGCIMLRNNRFSFENKRGDILVFSAAILDVFAIGYAMISIF